MKLLFLIIGLAVGFGSGIYWGVQHPTQATAVSAEEERQFLQAQIKVSQAVKAKLDQMATQHSAPSHSFGSGFVAGNSGADPEIVQLRDAQDAQLTQMNQRLKQLSQ